MDYFKEGEIIFYQNSEHFFEEKKNERVLLMTTKASIPYTDFQFQKNDTLLFGRESFLFQREGYRFFGIENQCKELMLL